MVSSERIYLQRAKTELESATILFEASRRKDIRDILALRNYNTYYSGAISHAYYSIFYCAKALLLTKSIDTRSPEVHSKTINEFKKQFIDTGLMDAKLFLIYKQMLIRADTLLEIFREEKRKRGDFTYNTIAQANTLPAQESIEHAKVFMKHSNTILLNNI